MRYVIMSVRDAKADAFGRPMYVHTVGAAVRSFTDEVNRNAEDNVMHHHPEDFFLYHLGFFDDSDGSFEVFEPKIVVNATTVKS